MTKGLVLTGISLLVILGVKLRKMYKKKSKLARVKKVKKNWMQKPKCVFFKRRQSLHFMGYVQPLVVAMLMEKRIILELPVRVLRWGQLALSRLNNSLQFRVNALQGDTARGCTGRSGFTTRPARSAR